MGATPRSDQDAQPQGDGGVAEDHEVATDGPTPERGDDGDAGIEDRRSGIPWKRIAVTAGGVALTVAGTIVATLAATNNTARRENASAYAHGLIDAVEAIRNGYDPFED